MSKPRFITICQQAKQLLDLIPVEEETIKNLIDDYREAAEIFFAEGMYWELYDFDKKYPDVTNPSSALRKVIEVYDSLPQDVYEIMKIDPFRPSVIFFCGRKAERAILNHQDVGEAMKNYQGNFMMELLSGIPKSNEPESTPPPSEDLPFGNKRLKSLAVGSEILEDKGEFVTVEQYETDENFIDVPVLATRLPGHHALPAQAFGGLGWGDVVIRINM